MLSTQCRLRHLKCDESKPTCTVCEQFGLVCGGYQSKIVFQSDNQVSDEHCRRYLYTDEERLVMTQRLTTSAPPKTTSTLLAEIEIECEDLADQQHPEFQICRGPFSVFRQPVQANCSEAVSSPSDEAIRDSDSEPYPSLHPHLSNSFLESLVPTSRTASPSPLLGYILTSPGCRSSGQDNLSLDVQTFPSLDDHALQDRSERPYRSRSPTPHGSDSTFLQHAAFLLKHYIEFIIGSLSPPHGKTPWHMLNKPLQLS